MVSWFYQMSTFVVLLQAEILWGVQQRSNSLLSSQPNYYSLHWVRDKTKIKTILEIYAILNIFPRILGNLSIKENSLEQGDP